MIEGEVPGNKAYRLGLEYEKRYRGCAQCTIAAIQDTLGIRDDAVYKAASGLAGGIGQCTDGACGGYTGAVLMASLLFGRERGKEETEAGVQGKSDAARLAAALHDRFIAEYGSVRCRDIHQRKFGRTFDLRDAGDKRAFDEAGAHRDDDKCGSVVGNGAKWAVELMLEERESGTCCPETLTGGKGINGSS